MYGLRSAEPQQSLQAALGLREAAASLASEAEETDLAEAPGAPATDAFGLPSEGLAVEEHRVRRGETFAEMLTAYDVPYPTVVELVGAAEPVFNVRHIRAGRPYRVYRDPASREVRHVVYEQDALRYVIFDVDDTLRVRTGERSVETVQKRASGTIRSSLYQTLAEADVNPMLAFDLSEVFAWQIDFYRIQRGDRFEVVYEEEQVDGEAVGLGKILAAHFTHNDEDFYGFYFEQDGRGEYFDEEGESLRKALLKAPLRYRRISSGYTKRRFHPVQKRYKAHLGTDYAAARGTPVRSVGDGKVLEAGRKRYNGNWVKIRHNATYTTGYLHLSKIAKGIRPGTEVEQGQVIGYVGSTGLATGPHLCYRFWKNGRQVDSRKEVMPPSEPVAPQHRMAFDQVLADLMPVLHTGEPSLAAMIGAPTVLSFTPAFTASPALR